MDYVWSSSTNNVYILSYVLFAFEINIRASAVLGLVGAGGIGLFYDSTLGLFNIQNSDDYSVHFSHCCHY